MKTVSIYEIGKYGWSCIVMRGEPLKHTSHLYCYLHNINKKNGSHHVYYGIYGSIADLESTGWATIWANESKESGIYWAKQPTLLFKRHEKN